MISKALEDKCVRLGINISKDNLRDIIRSPYLSASEVAAILRTVAK